MTEFEDEYSERLEAEFQEIEAALLSDTINTLSSTEPACLRERTAVREAIARRPAAHQPGVRVIDAQGLTRVMGSGLDPLATPLSAVMTRHPEALTPRDRVFFAVNRMSGAGYRTTPLVDETGWPIGIVRVHDFIEGPAHLFPEAVLNLRPRDSIKRPLEVDAG